MKLVARISDLRADWYKRCDKGKLKYYQSDLNDKLNELNASDKIIFDNLIDNAEEDVVDKKKWMRLMSIKKKLRQRFL